MKKSKKIILSIYACALCACGMVGVFYSINYEKDNCFWSENVEALTQEEYTSVTTWRCSGTPITTSCSIKCGICGTGVNGNGALDGSHSCSVIKN